ncbi:hypothetical protein B0H14DRAFT_2640955 [Mycena olivaceomarginata]|nr:hypothetical protein B0H14DRAFT_2640955 [Mycena olivaceomarginata]
MTGADCVQIWLKNVPKMSRSTHQGSPFSPAHELPCLDDSFADLFLQSGALLILIHLYFLPTGFYTRRIHPVPAQCLLLNVPQPPPEFTVTRLETGSDRCVQGTRPTLIKDAKILTGVRNGTEVIFGDVLLDKGIDGINTHDDAYKLAIVGAVTTAQILPGSANNIDPKASIGENPDRLYGQTRMDTAWGFRQAYNEARKIRDAQDAFCAAAHAGTWDGRSAFPESLQWEALVDVLLGRVKVVVFFPIFWGCADIAVSRSSRCTATRPSTLTPSFVYACPVASRLLPQLSNKFKFPIASIHHAGETYLVPDLLKRAWGNIPDITLFTSNFRKKREAYRGSEFAPCILANNGLPVIMKSDHPVLNSRYLMYEVQQAHYHSLNTGPAIASVTSTPVKALGVGWRIGPIATPSFEKEARDTIAHEGLPPLAGRRATSTVAFVNVSSAWVRRADGIRSLADATETNLTVIVHRGCIACAGPSAAGACAEFISASGVETVDLRGGALALGLTSFGSDLRLSEIVLEPSTNDGPVFDPLTVVVPT